jgi:nucleoside-diphosphate-sugar epimerase
MTYLVTGAAGLLGSHVVDLLVEQGYRPRSLVQPGEDVRHLEEAGAYVLVGDVRDRDAVIAAVGNVEYVIHCAAKTGPWGNEGDYVNINVRALEDLVRASVSVGVRRFVHISSITVHGNDVKGDADESRPLKVEPNPYSRSKVAGERLLEGMIRNDGAPVAIVRPGWIYGPRDRASFARFATMVQQRRMTLMGSGDNHIPLIYVRDAARGLLLAATSTAAEGRAYLLVNDQRVTQSQFFEAIARELGVKPPSRRIPYRLAVGLAAAAEWQAKVRGSGSPPPVTRYGVQLLGGENRFFVDRARRELGFQPEVDMAEGVQRAVAWVRATAGDPVAAGDR